MALNLLHDLRIDQGTGRTCNKLLSLFSYTESVLASCYNNNNINDINENQCKR